MSVGFCVFCIDKRYDYLVTTYLNSISGETNRFFGSTAGSALCLGYSQYYCKQCCPKGKDCNSNNKDMKLLKESLIANINISMSLYELNDIYLISN